MSVKLLQSIRRAAVKQNICVNDIFCNVENHGCRVGSHVDDPGQFLDSVQFLLLGFFFTQLFSTFDQHDMQNLNCAKKLKKYFFPKTFSKCYNLVRNNNTFLNFFFLRF